MKILLIYPNSYKGILGYMDRMALSEPLALEYIAAGAMIDNHEVRLLDLRLHVDKLDETISEYQPDLVGLTGFTMHVLRNLEVCARVKEILPRCKTAVGGLHATFEPVDFFEPQIDYIFVGEGVHSFRQVLNCLEKGEDVHSVPGVYSRINGTMQLGCKPHPYDITALPLPERSLAPGDRASYIIDYMKPIALMRTSLGCPYRCPFCSVWRLVDGRYLERDTDDVLAELKLIPEKHIHFVDDEPFVGQKRMKNLAEAIRKAGIEKEYYLYCRVETLIKNRELLEQWRDIGLRRLFVGVETIFDHEAVKYKKQQKQQDVIKAHQIAKEMGIGLFSGFIIDPDYTEKEFDALEKFLLENGIEYASFTVLTPLPGMEDGGTSYEKVIRMQKNGRPNWSEFDFQHPVTETKLPRHEFLKRFGQLYQKTSKHGMLNFSAFKNGQHPLPAHPVKENMQGVEEYNKQVSIELAKRVLSGGKKS